MLNFTLFCFSYIDIQISINFYLILILMCICKIINNVGKPKQFKTFNYFLFLLNNLFLLLVINIFSLDDCCYIFVFLKYLLSICVLTLYLLVFFLECENIFYWQCDLQWINFITMWPRSKRLFLAFSSESFAVIFCSWMR